MSYFLACSLLLNSEQEAEESRNLKEMGHAQIRGHMWPLKSLLRMQLKEPGGDSDFLLLSAFNLACRSHLLLSDQ